MVPLPNSHLSSFQCNEAPKTTLPPRLPGAPGPVISVSRATGGTKGAPDPVEGSGGSRDPINRGKLLGLTSLEPNLRNSSVKGRKRAVSGQNCDLPPPLAGWSWSFPPGFFGERLAHGYPLADPMEQRGPEAQGGAPGEGLAKK